jgi:menaquinone-dependent protoporphyrinogen oxidase
LKTLIVYGTRYGATATTSKEIANFLRGEGFTVRVVNLKEEKVNNISDYELIIVGSGMKINKWTKEIIVGSGMKINKWTKEPENFLKKFKKELQKRKVVIFVSSAIKAIYEHEGNTKELEKTQRKYLDEKAEKYSLNPIDMTIFGGVLNYDKMGFLTRKTVGQLWRKYEEMGIKKKDGIYDTRDWSAIRKWTKELVKKVRE